MGELKGNGKIWWVEFVVSSYCGGKNILADLFKTFQKNRIDGGFLVWIEIGLRRKVIRDFFGSFVFGF